MASDKIAIKPMSIPPGSSKRYVALGTAIVLTGLLVHFVGGSIPAAARDILGDALWATMMACWVSAIVPRQMRAVRVTIALAVCWAVEASQLWRAPFLEYARGTWIGPLVLGSGFDPRDLVAYMVGVLMFAVLDRWMTSERGDAPQR